MMKNILNWFKEKSNTIVWFIFTALILWYALWPVKPKQNVPLKEFADGIQNHLAWDIKGQCFFVRPNDDVTVYLIRVADCDRK